MTIVFLGKHGDGSHRVFLGKRYKGTAAPAVTLDAMVIGYTVAITHALMLVTIHEECHKLSRKALSRGHQSRGEKAKR